MGVKRLTITYRMCRAEGMETAENTISTVFAKDIAEDLLKNQGTSKHINRIIDGGVARWLSLLATLQGYDCGWFELAQEV